MSRAPSLLSDVDGRLLLIYNSDARQRRAGKRVINSDIWASGLVIDEPPAPPVFKSEKVQQPPSPIPTSEAKDVAGIRAYRIKIDGKTLRPLRGEFHRHTEISGDGGNDGTINDMFRYAIDVAAMDWIGNGDHDNGGGREYSWWITQKLSDVFHIGRSFTPMFTYERSVHYPDGHRNCMFSQRGIRTLPRLAPQEGEKKPNKVSAKDAPMLYRYLKRFKGFCSSHTSATDMGTDWRDNDPEVEPVIEIYQGDRQSYEYEGAPRSGSAEKSLGGWRPAGFYWKALEKGYQLGIQASSDHLSTHISYAIVYVEEPTRQAIVDAFKKRRSYCATDNIIVDVRMGDHIMGDELTTKEPPTLDVKIVGTDDVTRVDVIKNNEIVYTTEPKKKEVSFAWKDNSVKPGTSYYYVRCQQANDEMAWASPMWIDYQE